MRDYRVCVDSRGRGGEERVWGVPAQGVSVGKWRRDSSAPWAWCGAYFVHLFVELIISSEVNKMTM